MCTVTYIPSKDGFYLTSNRDENHKRGAAISPKVHGNLLYPKDSDKNGTWIAAKVNGGLVVLLNGALEKHIPQKNYRKSRGLLLVEAIATARPETYFDTAELEGIEPFTLIICSGQKVYECRWDSAKKIRTTLDPNVPHIWSSATLYDEIDRLAKKKRFENCLLTDSPSILDFHRAEALEGIISTVSITQAEVTFGRVRMTYDDLKSGTRQTQHFPAALPHIPRLSLRIFLVKLFSWEYWPYQLVYTPVMFYWLWLGIKSRAVFFFDTANPGMKNGGFAMDNKSDMYARIPQEYCPQTLLVKAGQPVENNAFSLPLIAKPDIGQRGLQVKLLKTQTELTNYAANSKVDFLLQEYIDYPKEAGIFYCRMPGSNGCITGIVGKELMSVIGDGRSSLLQLLADEPRYLLQIPVLVKTMPLALQSIIPAGEVCEPAPYGNHSRGAKFVDLSHQVNHELVKRIDEVCVQIPGFYYGRLDVKYNSWAELCAGKFKIIEVNGAASEPAHIYDSKHSIFFAWKEIIRHWAMLYQISKINRQKRGLKHMTYKQGMDMIKNNTQYFNLASSPK